MPGRSDTSETILIVRLGALGDIVHALPVATSLKRSFPSQRLVWITRPVWLPLFEGNPYLDEVFTIEPKSAWRSFGASWKALRALRPGKALDLQGLIQSALVARLTAPRELWGFDRHNARESFACALYDRRVRVSGPHRVERNLQLACAAGAATVSSEAWIPGGRPEDELPAGPFVLASPFAGWASKQWPIESYVQLSSQLADYGLPLVLNVPQARVANLSGVTAGRNNIRTHVSSISGLIHATRQAAAVVGVDSGPLHVAAALGKPGVAIYGPTDPAKTGPFGGTINILRTAGVDTTYARHTDIHASMRAIPPSQVAASLRECLARQAVLP